MIGRLQGIAGLRHVDIDWGQTQRTDELPFPLPALFFNIEQIDWKELGGGTQDGVIRLYAAFVVVVCVLFVVEDEGVAALHLIEKAHLEGTATTVSHEESSSHVPPAKLGEPATPAYSVDAIA